MTAEALQNALGFTAADLEANRAGRLSDGQQQHMNVQSKRGKSLNLVMAGVFIVFAIIIVTVVLPKLDDNSTSTSGSSSAVPPWIIFAVLGVVALIVLRTVFKTRSGMNRVASGSVQTVEGPAKTKARAIGNVDQLDVMPMFRLTVGKVTFPLSSQRQLGGFVDGVNYRCYYVKGTLPVLISAEEI